MTTTMFNPEDFLKSFHNFDSGIGDATHEDHFKMTPDSSNIWVIYNRFIPSVSSMLDACSPTLA